jgi:hypothetical protein
MRAHASLRLLCLSSLGLGCEAILGSFELEPVESTEVGLGSACAPDVARCNGSVLELCSPDRNGFERRGDCGGVHACDPSAGACHPCSPGDFACNGSQLQSCDASTSWQPGPKCATAELCTLAVDRRGGDCALPAMGCTPGGYVCDGRNLLRCSNGLDRAEFIERCATAAHCDPNLASAQAARGEKARCAPSCQGDNCGAECEPGTTRCAGGGNPELHQCNADGFWTTRDVCKNTALCSDSAGACLPPACKDGELRCDGQVLERCARDLTRFEDVGVCPDGELCDPVVGCLAAPCGEGTFRCNGSLLERCEAGSWEPRLRCQTSELCSTTGICNAPVCTPGTYRCDGQTFTPCADGRHRWEDELAGTCPAGESCSVYSDYDDWPACAPPEG